MEHQNIEKTTLAATGLYIGKWKLWQTLDWSKKNQKSKINICYVCIK